MLSAGSAAGGKLFKVVGFSWSVIHCVSEKKGPRHYRL